MTHFLLQVGDLFHFHPFAPPLYRRVVLTEVRPPTIPSPAASNGSDDLALFSLTRVEKEPSPREMLGVFALLRDAGTAGMQGDDAWPGGRWL